MGLLRQLEHLVPGRGHPAAPCQAGVGADEAKAAGEETVKQRVVWQVEWLLPSQGQLTSVST